MRARKEQSKETKRASQRMCIEFLHKIGINKPQNTKSESKNEHKERTYNKIQCPDRIFHLGFGAISQ